MNNPDSEALVEPAAPVKVMVGKNAALAAPILAFGAFNVCSEFKYIRPSLQDKRRDIGEQFIQR